MMIWAYGSSGFDMETVEFETMDACIIAGENISQYYNLKANIKWTCQAKG